MSRSELLSQLRKSNFYWALFILLSLSFVTIGVALWLEIAAGLRPCVLCYWQRAPYYIIIGLTLLTLLMIGMVRLQISYFLAMGVLGIIAVAAVINSVFGVYHAGIEWKWWIGPDSCLSVNAEKNLQQLFYEDFRPAYCDEAQIRILGLSLAGYNAIISFFLAMIALWGMRNDRDQIFVEKQR